MKRFLLMFSIIGALLLTGCAQNTQGGETVSGGDAEPAPVEAPTDGEAQSKPEINHSVLRALIVDGAETGKLVLAGEGDAPGVYLLNAADVSITLDGTAADATALEDGMTVEITFGGELPLTMPAELGEADSVAAWSLGTMQNPGGTTYDLCGLYLQVLNDLWERDSGLNGGAKYVSVDLSAAPGGLNEAAKYAVAWIFAQRHGVETLTLTYDELVEQGYLTDATPEGASWHAYQWDDGVLFRITDGERTQNEAYSLPAIQFDAEKWRSPLGAYYFGNCTAVWPEMGTWSSYHIGSEAIS